MSNITSDLLRHFQQQKPFIKKIINEYKKPILSNTFFNNIELLSSECDLIKFDKNEWFLRPDVFCYDQYNEPYIYPIILTVNNIPSIFQFVPENFIDNIILAPYISTILKVCEIIR